MEDHRSSPLLRDTDGDGFDDADEIRRADDGFDPNVPDERVSAWTYAKDYATGFALGDVRQLDSMAWLAGSLSSSASSLIPVFGWILGTVTDVRDVIANAIRGDWVGASLSGVSLVPYAGTRWPCRRRRPGSS